MIGETLTKLGISEQEARELIGGLGPSLPYTWLGETVAAEHGWRFLGPAQFMGSVGIGKSVPAGERRLSMLPPARIDVGDARLVAESAAVGFLELDTSGAPSAPTSQARLYFDGTNLWKVTSAGSQIIGPGSGEMVYADTGTLQIVNTAAETDLLNVTVPGGLLGTTKALYFKFLCYAFNNSGAVRTATFRLRYGAQVLASPGDNWGAGATIRSSGLDVMLRNNGATNDQRGFLEHVAGSNIIAQGQFTVDSTVNQTFRVTIQFSVANANLYIVRTLLVGTLWSLDQTL